MRCSPTSRSPSPSCREPDFRRFPVFATFGQETIQEGPPTNRYGKNSGQLIRNLVSKTGLPAVNKDILRDGAVALGVEVHYVGSVGHGVQWDMVN